MAKPDARDLPERSACLKNLLAFVDSDMLQLFVFAPRLIAQIAPPNRDTLKNSKTWSVLGARGGTKPLSKSVYGCLANILIFRGIGIVLVFPCPQACVTIRVQWWYQKWDCSYGAPDGQSREDDKGGTAWRWRRSSSRRL